jgi:hypothetical protein
MVNAHAVDDSEFSCRLLLLLARSSIFQQRLQPLSGYCGLAKVDWSIK